MLAETPLENGDGGVRVDDVYSVLLEPGEVMYQLAIRFGPPERHMPYVARLRWRTFWEPDFDGTSSP